MKLEQLLKNVEYKGKVPDCEITGITSDSRQSGPGMLFVCIKGTKSDGHAFAAQAVKAGCAAVICEKNLLVSCPQITVADTHSALALICAEFFGNPASGLKLVGVTGTKGKSTVTGILKHILEESGHKCGLIGTIKNMAGDEELASHFTTPMPFELHGLLRKMADTGCEYVVMEVSSHSLDQERVAGLRFEAGVFTNLSRDHLDYHGTMENYLAAKEKLFRQSKVAVVNIDDPCSGHVINSAPCRKITFSAGDPKADLYAGDIDYKPCGISYKIKGKTSCRVSANMPGKFSVYNTLAAITCAGVLGVPISRAASAVATFKGVKGRVEVVPTGKDFTVIIDYAHSPDSLDKVLETVKEFAPGRVVALFGCGGDRDRGKRPLMGKIAAKRADFLVVTSDNPRTEEPDAIIRDILGGLPGTQTPYVVIENRREAIKWAILNARKDDTIILAGKGHETYQILGTQRIHFDEREIVSDIIKAM